MKDEGGRLKGYGYADFEDRFDNVMFGLFIQTSSDISSNSDILL